MHVGMPPNNTQMNILYRRWGGDFYMVITRAAWLKQKLILCIYLENICTLKNPIGRLKYMQPIFEGLLFVFLKFIVFCLFV